MPKVIDIRTIIESIYFLLTKLESADKLKILKLMYLADKYHLIRYGRTITNDDYYAMKFGPIASNVMDVLEFDKEFSLSEEEYAYASALITPITPHSFKANSQAKSNLEMLSETDLEALNFAFNKFGAKTSAWLVEYTHLYPEWAQYKELFEAGQIKREKLDTEELVSVIDKDFDIPEEHLRETMRLLRGDFE